MADEDIDTIENIFAKDMDRLLAAREELDSAPPEEPESVADAFEIATTPLPPGPPTPDPLTPPTGPPSPPPGPPESDPLLAPLGLPSAPASQPTSAPPPGVFGAPPGPPPSGPPSSPPGPPSAPPMDAMPPGPPAPPSAPPMDAMPPGPPGPPSAPPMDLLLQGEPTSITDISQLVNEMDNEMSDAPDLSSESHMDALLSAMPSSPPLVEEISEAPPSTLTDHFEEPGPVIPTTPRFDRVDIDSWDSNWGEDWKEDASVFVSEDTGQVPAAVQDDVEWDSEAGSEQELQIEESLPNKSTLNRMKKAELVSLAESHGVEATGTKAQIIERLLS